MRSRDANVSAVTPVEADLMLYGLGVVTVGIVGYLVYLQIKKNIDNALASDIAQEVLAAAKTAAETTAAPYQPDTQTEDTYAGYP